MNKQQIWSWQFWNYQQSDNGLIVLFFSDILDALFNEFIILLSKKGARLFSFSINRL